MRPTLKTERLVLRPLTLQDAKTYAAYAGDEEIARMTGSVPLPFPTISAEFWIMQKLSKAKRGLSHPYVITLQGEMVGMIDLFKRDEDGPLEIGYSMAKEHWGKGYTTEACKVIIEEASNTLGARRIVAGVFSDNPASIRLLLNLGFTALETREEWFSMARLEKASGVKLSLDLTKTHKYLSLVTTDAFASA